MDAAESTTNSLTLNASHGDVSGSESDADDHMLLIGSCPAGER